MDTEKKHRTCIDASGIEQPEKSHYVCGPECPPVAITWDDVVAMYRNLGGEANARRAAKLRMTEEYAKDLIARVPHIKNYQQSGINQMLGIPIVPDDTLKYGEWKLLDQFGEVLHEHKLGD